MSYSGPRGRGAKSASQPPHNTLAPSCALANSCKSAVFPIPASAPSRAMHPAPSIARRSQSVSSARHFLRSSNSIENAVSSYDRTGTCNRSPACTQSGSKLELRLPPAMWVCGSSKLSRSCDSPISQANHDPRRLGCIGDFHMSRYLIEREFPDGLHIPLDESGAQLCRNVIDSNAEDGVTWLHSYVTPDRKRTFCLYDGPTPEAVRRAAVRSQLPITQITEVRVLDPYFYK